VINCFSVKHYLTNINETRVATPRQQTFGTGDFIGDRYRIVSELGRGGMGVVYLVKDRNLGDRELALKMIHPYLIANPEARKRFEDEVATCLDLNHSSIIRVHHFESSPELHYFTMEYLNGKNLAQYLSDREGDISPFTLAELRAVLLPLLDALSYAHKHTIHRDIKPENIMLLGEFPDVTIKILDFGIARTMSTSRFTQTAQGLGTPYYMAPEQVKEAHGIDLRADLYSVGMVLYEMLTGEKAVGVFEMPSELLSDVYQPFDNLVRTALAFKPDGRYQNADEMRKELSALGLSFWVPNIRGIEGP